MHPNPTGQENDAVIQPSRRKVATTIERPKPEKIRVELNVEKWPALWRPSDPARVEDGRDAEVVERARPAESEQVRALDEERPVLRIERLDRREIHLSGIHLDLPKVGVRREIQRQIARDPILEISSRAPEVIAGGAERIFLLEIETLVAARDVGHELERPSVSELLDSHQIWKARHESALGSRPIGGVVLLASSSDLA